MSLEKLFHLKENHTDVKTEVLAGITTFMTMAYILAVNPGILGATGMDSGAVFTATAVSALFATLCMAFMANYPFVLAPGMGLNAYFAYTVVLQMGYSWEMALTAVFAEGIIFILLSLTNVREKIFNAIPMTLKHSVSAGIGLFIAFIGLQNAKIVVDGATLVGLYSFKAAVQNGTFSTEGITVLLALIGILITAVLLVKQVKGGILWGYPCYMDFRHHLPVSRYLPGKPGGRSLQPSPGFFQWDCDSKHGPNFFEDGFQPSVLTGFLCSCICIPVCRSV